MNEKLKLIREKCIAANPDIVELKEGCEILAGDAQLRHTIYGINDRNGRFMAFLNKPFREDLVANSFYDCEFAEGADGLTILGRPIRLADAVLAIRAVDNREWSIYSQIINHWECHTDDLEQQSDETINFLHELLK